MIKRCLAVLLSVAFLAPSIALAQQPKAGVVTTLEGNVSARRVALPNPVPLKFKDDVLLQDTVTTGDKSLARMLLGGKAVVTVRERSVLTITEVPGRSTIELETGKFALAVAREKMRPGEEIQIRTPNAVAGVRGTVVITEVNRQSAQVAGAAPAVVTNFYVLRGTITAQQIDPGTRQPVGAPLQVGTLQAYSGAGNAAPRVAPVPPEQVGQITSGLQPSGPKGGEDTGKEQVKAQAVQTATTLLTVLTGGGPDSQVAFATTPTVNTASTTAPAQTNTTPKLAVTSEITKAQELAAESTAEQATAAAGLPRSFTSAFTDTSTSALISLSGKTVNLTGAEENAIEVLSGGDVSLAGPLLTLTSSTLEATGKLLEIENGKLTSTSTSPLFTFDPSTVDVESALIALNNGTLTLAGPLLKDTNGTLEGEDEFLRMKNGSTLKSTGTGALVQLSGTTVDFDAALSMTSSTMTLSGPLASVTSVKGVNTASGSSTPLFQLDASTLTSTGAGALLSFTSTDATPDGNFFRLQNKSTVELAGPLFSGTGGKLGSGTSSAIRAFISFLDSSTLKSTGTSALVSLSGVTFDAQGPFFNMRRSLSASSPTKVTLAGPLASISDSTVNTTTTGFGSTFGTSASSCCSTFGVEQGAVLTGTGSGALISVANSTVTIADSQSGGSFFFVTDTVTGFPSSELVAPSKVTLAGPLLSATSSTIKPLFNLLSVSRSTLSSTTSSALISLTSSTVAAGGNDISGTATPFARMLTLLSSATADTAASAASISLAGPFMSATGSTLSGVQFAGIFNGASFTSTSTSSLVSLDNTSLTLSTITQGSTTERGHFLNIGGRGSTGGTTFAKMDLKGPLLSVSNGGTLTLSGSLVNVFSGGEIIEAHPTSPFVSITGGTHKIASDSTLPLLGLFGRSSATTTETIATSGLATSDSTLTLGTDQPLQRSGSGALLELSGATVSAEKGLNMDDALLSASAPLLNLKSGATLTSAADALNLTSQAKLTATGPLVKLDASTLTITNGHAIRIMGGSFLNVTGDLFSLANASKLNITGGGALFISGSSVVKISGALVNFGGSGSNQINISNSFSPNGSCSVQCGGLSVSTQNGASVSNVSITNAVKNSNLGTVTLSSGSHIVLDGANSKVIISGQ